MDSSSNEQYVVDSSSNEEYVVLHFMPVSPTSCDDDEQLPSEGRAAEASAINARGGHR